jgi:hypothetical protein
MIFKYCSSLPPSPRPHEDGQGCWFEICRGGVEGLLKDSDKYTQVHCTGYLLLLPLSHCPTPHVLYAHLSPLILWDHPWEPLTSPSPPPRSQTLRFWASQLSAFSFQLGEVCHKRRLQVYFIAPFIEETYQEKNIIFEMGIKFCAFWYHICKKSKVYGRKIR